MNPPRAFLVLLALLPGPVSGEQVAVRVSRHPEGPRYAVRAVETRAADLAAALAEAGGCEIEVDEKLSARRLSLALTPRSLERVCGRLSRELDARLVVRYTLQRTAAGEQARPNRWAFARDPVDLDALRMPVREAVEALGPPVEVGPRVTGRVTLRAEGRPLGWVLDGIAAQTGCIWKPVLRFEARRPTDGENAGLELMHDHLALFGALSSADRQEEIAEELERLNSLAPADRERAAHRMAAEITGLGSLMRRVPGEHRATVGAQVLPIARDYVRVLHRERLRCPEPLLRALGQLDSALSR